MTTFEKLRNCITEPRCRDCEGIPGVCEEEHQSVSIPKALALDVLKLLKEQEAKKVKESTNMYTGSPITHCPKCGISLDRYLYGRQYEGQINYCPMCGQKVKWE